MKFDKILATSQSRTKAPTEDTVIEESRIIKDNAEIPLTDIDFIATIMLHSLLTLTKKS